MKASVSATAKILKANNCEEKEREAYFTQKKVESVSIQGDLEGAAAASEHKAKKAKKAALLEISKSAKAETANRSITM